MEKLRVFESFAGIGAVTKALTLLDIPYELVGFSEIDGFAIKSFCAVHGVADKLNYGDVCNIDETVLPDFDLYTFGAPCQDYSVAGKQKGAVWKCDACGYEYNPLDVHWSTRHICNVCGSKGISKTRSSLVVEALRIIRYKKPKYLLMENVKNLIGKQFTPSFDKIIAELQEYGYTTYWKVLNAKDFGDAQSRERVFVTSIRKDIDKGLYAFPVGYDRGIRLKDILETSVDDKYYINIDGLTDNLPPRDDVQNTHRIIRYDLIMPVRVRKFDVAIKSLQTLLRSAKRQVNLSNKVLSEKLDRPLTLVEHWFRTDKYFAIPDEDVWFRLKELLQITSKVFDEAITTFIIKDGVYDKTNRVYDIEGISPTITCVSANEKILVPIVENGYEVGYKLRRLTAKECWLLMGFEATDYDKAQAVGVSEAQLYKQAGNSISVGCLVSMFKVLFGQHNEEVTDV